VATELGDWSFHCHKSHHTMNAMGHEVPTMLGVKQDDLVEKISNLVPDYMPMGETGMNEMSDMASMMEMPLPENTLPMMTGQGQYGPINMGGMFSVLKVRDGLAKGDYKDPGPYQHPKNTRAYEYTGEVPEVKRAATVETQPAVELQVRKPTGHEGH
jgi:hypothetical protein